MRITVYVLAAGLLIGCQGGSPPASTQQTGGTGGTDASTDVAAAGGQGGPVGSGGGGVAGASSHTGGAGGHGGSAVSAYYVSPSGEDAASGTSEAAPWKTLARAQAAMQASSIETTFLMSGTFALAAPLALSGADAGESWLAAAGATPVLDGGGTVAAAITDSGGSKIAIRWLTIQNFSQHGIRTSGVTGVVIDSNTILNISSTNWNEGPIEIDGTFTGGQITHNLIRKAGYTGIAVHSAAGNDISNVLIDGNAVYDTMLAVADGGAIYVMDRAHASTGIVISHNVVGNHGTAGNGSKGIYLDDLASHVTVSDNVVYGTGQWAFQIHGGDHDIFQNNVFDLTQGGKLGLYQDDPKWGDFGMGSNVFTCNIVYSGGAAPSTLWEVQKSGTAAIALPAVSGNDYWRVGGALPNTAPVVDSSPATVDPKFVDAAKADYALQGAAPIACFKPIDASGVGPVPNG